MSHKLINLLDRIGAIRKDRLTEYFPRVRDRDDIKVLRCEYSEVIVLSSIAHIESSDYYERRREKSSIEVNSKEIITPRLDDNIRRASEFGHFVRNKRWLDFGCGKGGMLDELCESTEFSVGLEPNRDRQEICRRKGHQVVSSLEEVDKESVDVITLFHVLEHIPNPLTTLRKLIERLNSNGLLLLEIPHARDALLTLYECNAFKSFTFWSEHLVLHTRNSLRLLLQEAGFVDIEIYGCQRYPLSNHLYWLSQGRPGGHDAWRFLSGYDLDHQYAARLAMIDRTDTLMALCKLRKQNIV